MPGLGRLSGLPATGSCGGRCAVAGPLPAAARVVADRRLSRASRCWRRAFRARRCQRAIRSRAADGLQSRNSFADADVTLAISARVPGRPGRAHSMDAMSCRGSLHGRSAPHPPSGRGRGAARGPAGRAARGGPAAAGEARDRPDRAGHPPRPLRVLHEAARVPGRGAPGRADHRRLHGAGRRPQRALGGAPGAQPRGDRRQRGDLPGAGVQGARPRAHRGAPQRRVAGRWTARSSSGSLRRFTIARLLERDDFTKRMERPSRSRRSSCSTRCSRATTRWRSRPTSSSGAPTRSSTCCSAATSRTRSASPPQSVMTMPILPGTDGVRRMSKSLGNYVGVTDAPEEMFGKLMSVPDDVMGQYYLLLLGEELDSSAARRSRPSASWRGGWWTLPRRGGRGGRGALRPGARPPRDPRRHRPRSRSSRPTTGRSTCRRCSPERSGISRGEARRLIAQGGVQARRRRSGRLDLPAAELEGGPAGGKRRFRA